MHNSRLLGLVAAATLCFAGTAALAKKPVKPAAHPAAHAAQAPAAQETVTTVPPPSGNWEPAPPSNSPGWVWSAGYYQWKEGRYQWKAGEWVADRPGMDYRQHAWLQQGDKWVLTGGDWVPEAHASNTR